jgi:outer membrane murein-binding lipoprotein Lpp
MRVGAVALAGCLVLAACSGGSRWDTTARQITAQADQLQAAKNAHDDTRVAQDVDTLETTCHTAATQKPDHSLSDGAVRAFCGLLGVQLP